MIEGYCDRLIRRGGWQEDAALRRCDAPIGPRNTWSNVAYFLAGLAIYFASPGLETGILMAMCLFLAIGSGLYHAYKTPYFNAWDHNGIYMVFGALAVYGWGGPAWLMLVVGFLAAWGGTYWRGLARLDSQIGVLLALALVPVFLAEWSYGLLVLPIYGFGYCIQRLDHAKSPLTSVWGHAFWHVITAVAIFLTALGET